MAWSTINVPEVIRKSARIMMQRIAPDTDYRPTWHTRLTEHCSRAPLKLQILPVDRDRMAMWFCRRPTSVLLGGWTSSERNVISYVVPSRGTTGQLTLVSRLTTADSSLPCHVLSPSRGTHASLVVAAGLMQRSHEMFSRESFTQQSWTH